MIQYSTWWYKCSIYSTVVLLYRHSPYRYRTVYTVLYDCSLYSLCTVASLPYRVRVALRRKKLKSGRPPERACFLFIINTVALPGSLGIRTITCREMRTGVYGVYGGTRYHLLCMLCTVVLCTVHCTVLTTCCTPQTTNHTHRSSQGEQFSLRSSSSFQPVTPV